jgi:DNA-directed RNA polymerase subunit beta'
MVVYVPLSLEARAEARLLMFSETNLLSPAIGDPISIMTHDMLLGLYISMVRNSQGIYGNRYHPYHSEKKSFSCKKPFFYSYDDVLRAYRQKRIDLYISLWFLWGEVDLLIITSINQEAPIEVQYESLGTFHEIHEHYRIRKGRMGEILNIYIFEQLLVILISIKKWKKPYKVLPVLNTQRNHYQLSGSNVIDLMIFSLVHT